MSNLLLVIVGGKQACNWNHAWKKSRIVRQTSNLPSESKVSDHRKINCISRCPVNVLVRALTMKNLLISDWLSVFLSMGIFYTSDLCDPNSYQTSYEWRIRRHKNYICKTSFLSQCCHSPIAQNTIHKSWSQWGLAIFKSAYGNVLTRGYIPYPVFIAKISEYRHCIRQVSQRAGLIRRSSASWDAQCPSQDLHNAEFADFRSLTINSPLHKWSKLLQNILRKEKEYKDHMCKTPSLTQQRHSPMTEYTP